MTKPPQADELLPVTEADEAEALLTLKNLIHYRNRGINERDDVATLARMIARHRLSSEQARPVVPQADELLPVIREALFNLGVSHNTFVTILKPVAVKGIHEWRTGIGKEAVQYALESANAASDAIAKIDAALSALPPTEPVERETVSEGVEPPDFRLSLATALFEACYDARLHGWSDETRDHWLARADKAIGIAAPQSAAPIRVTEADFTKAAAEVKRLQSDINITNADHIALWLEANIENSPLGWLACRIVEAHEAATLTPSETRESIRGEMREEVLNDIAAMMSEFVDNWPQPKKLSTALALIAKTMRVALDPPKHTYWHAGEAECPREIKAGNGELHTLRCKVCGEDNPRENRCLLRALPSSEHET